MCRFRWRIVLVLFLGVGVVWSCWDVDRGSVHWWWCGWGHSVEDLISVMRVA